MRRLRLPSPQPSPDGRGGAAAPPAIPSPSAITAITRLRCRLRPITVDYGGDYGDYGDTLLNCPPKVRQGELSDRAC
jgi:hypothetical protein